MIIRTNVLICSVLQAESTRNHPQLVKAEPFIEMPCMNICRDNRVELQNPKAGVPPLCKRVTYQLLPNMRSPAIPAYCIAGIANMPAAADVVGMKNIKPADSMGSRIFRHGAVCLPGKEVRACL